MPMPSYVESGKQCLIFSPSKFRSLARIANLTRFKTSLATIATLATLLDHNRLFPELRHHRIRGRFDTYTTETTGGINILRS